MPSLYDTTYVTVPSHYDTTFSSNCALCQPWMEEYCVKEEKSPALIEMIQRSFLVLNVLTTDFFFSFLPLFLFPSLSFALFLSVKM